MVIMGRLVPNGHILSQILIAQEGEAGGEREILYNVQVYIAKPYKISPCTSFEMTTF